MGVWGVRIEKRGILGELLGDAGGRGRERGDVRGKRHRGCVITMASMKPPYLSTGGMIVWKPESSISFSSPGSLVIPTRSLSANSPYGAGEAFSRARAMGAPKR